MPGPTSRAGITCRYESPLHNSAQVTFVARAGFLFVPSATGQLFHFDKNKFSADELTFSSPPPKPLTQTQQAAAGDR